MVRSLKIHLQGSLNFFWLISIRYEKIACTNFKYFEGIEKYRFSKIGTMVRYQKVLIPEYGKETGYRKVSIPEKGIDTQH